ncbi:MAG: TldD/PmbA family protein, partial [Verrucomicrobia bacterium]|nr:TldD/PmbA family protein [Verrucomicrobiota bacterium]
MKRILSKVKADYADLRYELKTETKIACDARELSLMTSNSTDGYVLRVLKNGGLATISFTKASDADKAIWTAEENAALIGKRIEAPVQFAKVEPIKDAYHPKLDIDPRQVPIDEKLELLWHYNEIPLQQSKVATTTTGYLDLTRDRYFVSSEGAEIREDLVTTRVLGTITSKDGALTQTVRTACGGSDGFARVKNREPEFEEKTALALNMLKATPVKAGSYRVILNPRLSGVFTHEAFGHFSEADLIEDAPTMRAKMHLGAKLGTDSLNIKDDPTRLNQLGHYKYDDEGVPARSTQLMKDGVLVGRLHSRRTAAAYGEPVSGHSIAEDFRFAPIIRMGCIFIEPGRWSFEDLCAKLGDGLYLVNSMGGQTEGENFTFGAQYGYRVKGGKLTDMIRDINISGSLYATLKRISAIGNDLLLGEAGGCGKG